MKDFYNIIIVSKNFINTNYLILDEPVFLINQTTIKINDTIISFDYLIFDDCNLITNLNNSSILCESSHPVTNMFGQTSLENIIYKKNINEVLSDLINNEI